MLEETEYMLGKSIRGRMFDDVDGRLGNNKSMANALFRESIQFFVLKTGILRKTHSSFLIQRKNLETAKNTSSNDFFRNKMRDSHA